MYRVYAEVNENKEVDRFYSDCFVEVKIGDVLFKEGLGDEYVHVGYLKVYDDNMCHMYKEVDGKIVETTEEDRKNELEKIQETLNKQTIQEEVLNNKLCIAEATSILFEIDDRLYEVEEKLGGKA